MGVQLSKVGDKKLIKGYKLSQQTAKKIDISMIGNPTNFRHTYHVGADYVNTEQITGNNIPLTSEESDFNISKSFQQLQMHTPKTGHSQSDGSDSTKIVCSEAPISSNLSLAPTLKSNTTEHKKKLVHLARTDSLVAVEEKALFLPHLYSEVDLVFRDRVDAQLTELIRKRPRYARNKFLNGNLSSNKPRLMI
ncbi:hypothetical protein G6F37_003424 [Rhizopus arrhizus]|nr:hypothetical protein G6F38_008671 [Rhizopus arrhizus]KAG1161055.1 hypothetical protein G6F37_003424 [Rhizopus arrhizus]